MKAATRKKHSLGPHSLGAGYFRVFVGSPDTGSVHTPAGGGAIALLGFEEAQLVTFRVVHAIVVLYGPLGFQPPPRLVAVSQFRLHHQTFGCH